MLVKSRSRIVDCGHGFYDYDGAWDDDRVVTSFNDHFGVFSIFGDGGLWL